MDPSIHPDAMSRLDRRAIEQYGIPGLILMENAALRAFDSLLELASSLPSRATAADVVVFSGRGNNGGDGFAIARHAHNSGMKVSVHLLGETTRIERDSDAGVNLTILERMGIAVTEILDPDDIDAALEGCTAETIIVDAIFGTGLRGAARGLGAELIAAINESEGCKLAIDIPSGLDSSTGRATGGAVRAHRTVTFALPKHGLVVADGPGFTGDLVVAPISIPREEIEKAVADARDPSE